MYSSILLDIINPDDSEILFSAKEKDDIDYDTVNKLAIMNTYFEDFLVSIKNAATIKEINPAKFDAIGSAQDIIKKFEGKTIE